MITRRFFTVVGIAWLHLLLLNNINMNPVESLTTTSTNQGHSSIVKAILFDIDGTLVNTDSIHLAVFQELLLQEEDFQLEQDMEKKNPIDEDFFRQYISGRANALITADFFPSWSLNKREAFSIRKEERFRELSKDQLKELKMPGLDRIRKWVDNNGLGKAAVTNAPRLNGESMLCGIGYRNWFGQDGLIIGDECEKPKPDPCPYLTACQHITVVDKEGKNKKAIVFAEDCLVFEDSPSGARAGVAAGAFVIGITSGQDKKTLHDAGCQLVIQDFEDPKLWNHLNTLIPTPPTIS